METNKSDFGWKVYAHIDASPTNGNQIDRRRFGLAIRRALKKKPWLNPADGESKPAKIGLWKDHILRSGDFVLHVKKNLKSSQLHAFQLFLHELIKELVSMNIPNVWFIDAHVEMTGKSIALTCSKYE